MTEPYRPWSPVDVERKLRQSITEVARAEAALRDARDAETDAELAYQSVQRRAILSEDCPKVRRDGATAAERDAWVGERCAEQYQAYRIAATKAQAAADHVRAVRDIAVTVQSIGALVRQAYQMAGVVS
ncbi:hypothetical protein [Sciscionella sediminilitoris]|uniref:hypothetical protein n=1 Tax=Sciscionella sediminilitoris TaxID=1445613 RepID=UPI0004DF952C|nr:hypothetical protein [Sciscionella sp. SE31]